VGASERRNAGSNPESTRRPFGLFLEEEAKDDLVAAASHYEWEQEGLGGRFHDTVWRTLERILDNPYQYQAATRLYRRAKVADFPYCIYYAIFDRDRIVDVISVHHAKRHPKNWRQRKPTWRK